MTAKQLPKLRLTQLKQIEAKTDNQDKAFEAWDDGDNLLMTGSAGTGKTFVGMALALESVLNKEHDSVTILRSVVPTRDIGFLPGSEEEKLDVYCRPYINIVNELFQSGAGWLRAKAHNQIIFESTSYIRGQTWNDTIVLVDEIQNMTGHELDSVITRVGNNCRLIFCGDYFQTDFTRESDKAGFSDFMTIIESLNGFTSIEFTWQDIVRSGLVRDYIMTKEMLKKKGKIHSLV